jgi:hypothetical protein
LGIEIFDNFFVLSLKKFDGSIQEGIVFLPGAFADAGSDTPFDGIEQTGADAPFKLFIGTLSEGKEAGKELTGLACRVGARIGAEVETILPGSPFITDEADHWPGMGGIDHQADECLVVL